MVNVGEELHCFRLGEGDSDVKKLIMYRKTNPIYLTKEWRRKRKQILIKDKYECHKCKAKGLYSKATCVHHVKHLEEYPELALEDFYVDEYGRQRRQLLSLCDACHKEEHKELYVAKLVLTPERW